MPSLSAAVSNVDRAHSALWFRRAARLVDRNDDLDIAGPPRTVSNQLSEDQGPLGSLARASKVRHYQGRAGS